MTEKSRYVIVTEVLSFTAAGHEHQEIKKDEAAFVVVVSAEDGGRCAGRVAWILSRDDDELRTADPRIFEPIIAQSELVKAKDETIAALRAHIEDLRLLNRHEITAGAGRPKIENGANQ